MSLVDKVINSPGYQIVKIFDMDQFNKLRSKFINKVGLNNSQDANRARKDLAKMSNSEINKAMINLLSFNEASEMMINACKDIVKELSGPEIFIQRRANTIFNLPGKNQRRISRLCRH